MTVPTLVLPGRIFDQSGDILDAALSEEGKKSAAEITTWVDRHYSFPIEELTFGGFLARQPLARAIIPAKIAATTRRLQRLAAAHPDLAEVYEKRAAFSRTRENLDPGKAVQRKEAIELLERLEDHLVDSRNVMVPPDYSAADVVWTVFLARMEFTGMKEEIALRSALTCCWQAMKARNSFTAADI